MEEVIFFLAAHAIQCLKKKIVSASHVRPNLDVLCMHKNVPEPVVCLTIHPILSDRSSLPL